MSGYAGIMINHSRRPITTVRNGNVFYIWWNDARDVEGFRTSGYVVQKVANNPVVIFAVNRDGILPDNLEQVLLEITATEPSWQRELPDV